MVFAGCRRLSPGWQASLARGVAHARTDPCARLLLYVKLRSCFLGLSPFTGVYSMGTSPRHRFARTGRRVVVPALLATFGIISTANAHDFWVIPDMFVFRADSMIHASGRAGTRFPVGTAVQPARVADARIIGATTHTKITQLSVEGSSLRLHEKAPASGQYLIAVTLTSTPTRATSANLLRFLRAEGGATEATRLEKENALVGQDSLVYQATSYATAIVEVGRGGPRAFAVSTGLPLEFIPVNDPAHLHVGDTLHVKIVGDGKAVPGIGVFAGPAVDTTASASGATPATAANTSLALSADGNGVLHLPLTSAAAWNLRAAYVYRRSGAPEWRIARATYVFNVGASH